MNLMVILLVGKIETILLDNVGIASQEKDELSFIKRCYWKDSPINCTSIFQKRPTDKGMCCSFNMEKVERALKESRYKHAISQRQSDDDKNAFEISKKPSWYVENNEPKPGAGQDKGLTLIVDGHSNRLSRASVSDDFRGFVTVVDDREKFPLVSLSNLIVRPGMVNQIKVKATLVQAKDEIRKYSPQRRNCYFPDEYKLEIHQNYSHPNCIFECETQFAAKCLKTCNEHGAVCNCFSDSVLLETTSNTSCIPWFFPTHNNREEKMCNPWNIRKFLQIMKKQIPDDQCKHCLPDCTTTEYDTSISHAEFQRCDKASMGGSGMLCDLTDHPLNPSPWTFIVKKEFEDKNLDIPWYLKKIIGANNKSYTRFPDQRKKVMNSKDMVFPTQLAEQPTYNAFEKDIGIINVFFGKKEMTKFVKSNRMSTYGFIAQIGGSLGFAMGISIISLLELFYWFIIRFFKNISLCMMSPKN